MSQRNKPETSNNAYEQKSKSDPANGITRWGRWVRILISLSIWLLYTDAHRRILITEIGAPEHKWR
jgi:hypothetical protein